MVLKHVSDAGWANAGADSPVRVPAQRDGLLHGLRQPVADSLGKEEGHEPTDDGGNPENEHRSWPAEQSDEQCQDGSNPGDSAAATDGSVADHRWEQLSSVDLNRKVINESWDL